MQVRGSPGATDFAVRSTVVATCLAAYAARLMWLLVQPTTEAVKHIPDDAFYYLVMARHMSSDGRWSFDGTSTATGFHPLHAWILGALESLSPGAPMCLHQIVVGLLSAAALGLAAFVLAATLSRRTHPLGVLAGGAVFTAPIIVLQVTWLMEAPWVVLFAALCVSTVLDGSGRRGMLSATAAGALGSFSRTDFGLLPLVLAASLWFFPKRSATPERLRSLACLLGATLGLFAFLHQVHEVSGDWVQSSARIKTLWGDVYGYRPQDYLRLPLQLLVAPGSVGVFLVVAVRKLAQPSSTNTESRSASISLTAMCAIVTLGYVLLYGHNSSAAQPWYVAPFVVPVALIVGIGVGELALNMIPSRTVIRYSVWMTVVGALISFAIATLPAWPHQVNMMGAGQWLRDHPQDGHVAAFNAGLMSYFAEQEVINIDGLVNDDVYPYASSDRLVDYLLARDVRYVLDYPAMWEHEDYERRGGHSNGALRRRLRLQVSIPPIEEDRTWESCHPGLYEFQAAIPPAPGR